MSAGTIAPVDPTVVAANEKQYVTGSRLAQKNVGKKSGPMTQEDKEALERELANSVNVHHAK